ncbi:hypothetical protein INT43_007180 [Umbelopsis isabellina]|uniref:MARVEL domain-containing protein n=1 Tax=Mortierella isabellina TaxID=91625 RepID=A0A8H7PXU8_MORIS|nr:hypothetical protein INT43_007180 [Umbelopsis isabellina]
MAFTVQLPITVPSNMPNLSTVKFWLHIIQFALTLLTIIIIAPVIGIEAKYWGGSKAGPNWTLVVCIITLLAPVAMIYFPWAYDRQDKFKVLGKFFIKSRTALVLTGFNSLLWATAAIAMTVHSTDAANCALDSDLEKSDGSYASSWANQCNCGKAAAGFAWLTTFAWLGTVAVSAIVMYTEKQQIQQNLKTHEMNAAADRHGEPPMDPSYRPYDEEEFDGGVGGAGSYEQMPLNSPAPEMHQQAPYYDHSPPARPQSHSPDYHGYDSPTPMSIPMPQPTPGPVYGEPTTYQPPQTYDNGAHNGYYRQ